MTALDETAQVLAAFHRIKANKLCRLIERGSGDSVLVRLSRDHIFPYNPSVDYSLLEAGPWSRDGRSLLSFIEYRVPFADMPDFAECLDATYVAHMVARIK